MRAKTLDASHLGKVQVAFATGDVEEPEVENDSRNADHVDDVTAVMNLQVELLELHQQTTKMLQALSNRLDALQDKAPRRGRRSQRS
jgi:hypothetical protein